MTMVPPAGSAPPPAPPAVVSDDAVVVGAVVSVLVVEDDEPDAVVSLLGDVDPVVAEPSVDAWLESVPAVAFDSSVWTRRVGALEPPWPAPAGS